MDSSLFFGLDPTGREAMALCAAASVILAVLIVGGFVLLGLADRDGRPVWVVRRGPRELGVLALWRLDRALRRHRTSRRSVVAGSQPAQPSVLGGRR